MTLDRWPNPDAPPPRRRAVQRPISRRLGVVAAMLLGAIGLVLFVYADLATNRPLRLTAALVMTLALLVGTFSARRDALRLPRR